MRMIVYAWHPPFQLLISGGSRHRGCRRRGCHRRGCRRRSCHRPLPIVWFGGLVIRMATQQHWLLFGKIIQLRQDPLEGSLNLLDPSRK